MPEDRMDDFAQLGEKLEHELCGFSMEDRVILMDSSTLLRKLCEKININRGYRTVWICEKKEIGRLYARCAYGGVSRKSNATGKRKRESKKVGCNAVVRTVPLCRHKEFGYLEDNIEKRFTSLADDTSSRTSERKQKVTFCIIHYMDLVHNSHEVEQTEGEVSIFNCTSDVLANDSVVDLLKGFLNIFPSGKGSIIKAQLLLESTLPSVYIPPNILKSVITKLRHVENDTEMLLKELRNGMGSKGTVEYFKYTKEDNSGVVDFVAWTYHGAKDIVGRCGDLLFWDSTHNVTRYDYKLSSLTLVDSEGKSRCVMVCLMLHERAQDFKSLLDCWHEAFKVRLPSVVFTDGDDGMSIALSTLPYFDDISHLLCSFHVFDLNVKKKIQPLLRNGNASWPEFRKQLSLCREATEKKEFDDLWKCILQNTFSGEKQAEKARYYLERFIFSKRKQWALYCNTTLFTLGASTTQRSESWNSVLKAVSKVNELQNLVSTLKCLTASQGKEEKKSRSSSKRKEVIRPLKELLGNALSMKLIKSGLSRYGCIELSHEIQVAFTLSVIGLTFNPEERTDGNFHIISEVSDVPFYGRKESGSTGMSVLLSITEEGNISKMDCTCFYPNRMKIPCRHVIQLCMNVDKKELTGVEEFVRKKRFNNFLELILLQSWSERWKNPLYDCSTELYSSTDEESGMDVPLEKKVISNTKTSNEENRESMKTIPLPIMYTSEYPFPNSIADGGGRIAYSKLISQFKALSEVLTRSNDHLWIAQTMYELSDRTIELISKWEVHAGRNSPEMKTTLKRELAHAIADNFLHNNDGPVRENPQQCTESSSDTSEILEESKKGRATLMDREKIQDPPKRMDHRAVNKSNIHKYKSRLSRTRRRDASRRSTSKTDTYSKGAFLQGSYRLEFACPHCTDITPQNNPENVRQHMKARHTNRKVSSIHCMKTAAATFHGRLDNSREENQKTSSSSNTSHFSNENDERKTEDATLPVSDNEQKLCSIREMIPNVSECNVIWKSKVTKNVYETFSDMVFIGDYVEVFWKLDLAWYRGKVANTKLESDKRLVQILYNDGDKEFLNLHTHKWRPIKTGGSEPSLTLLEKENSYTCQQLFQYAEAEKSSWMTFSVGKIRSVRMSPTDILSLKDDCWLTDGIVDVFISGLCQHSTHVDDRRFAQLDSQLIVLASSPSTINQLSKTMKGIALHDLDDMLLPICFNSHWYLCIANITSRELFVIDPKRPKVLLETSLLQSTIRNAFKELTKMYDSKYDVCKEWELRSPESLSTELNLPMQPSQNGSDCGVLVCLYSWAIITHQKMTTIPVSTFSSSMTQAREAIASLLYSWKS